MFKSFVCILDISIADTLFDKVGEDIQDRGIMYIFSTGPSCRGMIILQYLLARLCVLAFAFAYGLIKRL